MRESAIMILIHSTPGAHIYVALGEEGGEVWRPTNSGCFFGGGVILTVLKNMLHCTLP